MAEDTSANAGSQLTLTEVASSCDVDKSEDRGPNDTDAENSEASLSLDSVPYKQVEQSVYEQNQTQNDTQESVISVGWSSGDVGLSRGGEVLKSWLDDGRRLMADVVYEAQHSDHDFLPSQYETLDSAPLWALPKIIGHWGYLSFLGCVDLCRLAGEKASSYLTRHR